MDEDAALAALLTALEDLHNIRNEMHACIKQARLRKGTAVGAIATAAVHSLEIGSLDELFVSTGQIKCLFS